MRVAPRDFVAPASRRLIPAYNLGMVTVRRRKRLPHWEESPATYFVTFRLADSLPSAVLRKIEFERKDIVATAKAMDRELTVHERQRLAKLFGEKVESQLDAGTGECFLARPIIAQLAAQTLSHFEGVRYRIFAWCVMPNHVHVVFRPSAGHKLAGIIHSWKSYSAKEANWILKRSGDFWQREYYDHLVRDERDLRRCIEYVLDNPQKARLIRWPWVGESPL